ncbi:hypothetical protein BDP27DRAFT_1431735 [Rhodocollybia butyracea]|uniref:Uncharacterized protein n=1 Tax=Rhodocollybia butyracea TaxID=206335 RepID=A0A9P5P6J0_9AGAR|nr:hypothetical protein BDP27DRAFT_1431735 [Rhodocollybia butyracea]
MPAQLRCGQPVGQRKKPLPANNLFLCQCENCQSAGSVATDTGEVKGKLFDSKLELEDHKRFLGNLACLIANTGPTVPDFIPPVPRSAAHPIATALDSLIDRFDHLAIPVASTPPDSAVILPVLAENEPSDAVDFDYELLRVQEIRSQLERNHNWQPTETDDSPTNSELRGHLEWLETCSSWMESLPRFEDSRQRLLVKAVRQMLAAEKKKIIDLLEKEWARQWSVAEKGQQRVQVSNAPKMDVESSKQGYFIVLVVAAVLYLFCNLTLTPGLRFLLGSMRIVCGLSGKDIEEIKAFIPKDPHTASGKAVFA